MKAGRNYPELCLAMEAEIDHIGYAVKHIETAVSAFEKLGYSFGRTVADETRHVMAVMGTLGSVKLELIAPHARGVSPVDNYLKKLGNTPYHICYRVGNIEEAVRRMRRQQFILVSAPAWYELLNGVAAFLFSTETGLIELVEHYETERT